jgi:hypothetical protein
MVPNLLWPGAAGRTPRAAVPRDREAGRAGWTRRSPTPRSTSPSSRHTRSLPMTGCAAANGGSTPLSGQKSLSKLAPGVLILCQELATVAEALLATKGWAVRAVEDTAFPLLRWLGRPRLARLVARQFARHLVSVSASEITATAHALRAYGVLICVVDGRNLAQCRCLRQIAASGSRERIRAKVREIVGQGLEPLA